MLKSRPYSTVSPKDAVPRSTPPPAVGATGPFDANLTRARPMHESSKRRAHRLRMKAVLAAAKPAI